MAGSVRPRAKWSRAHSGASAADAIALEGSSSPPPTASTSGPSEPRSQASRYRPSVERAARAETIDRGQSDENEDDDDDDFFMRRRTVQRPGAAPHHHSRSSASVYKPGEASKSAHLQRSRAADYGDYPSEDDDEEEAPSSSQTSADRRRQKKRRRERAPSWTRQIPSAHSDGLIDSGPDANRERSGSADDDWSSPSAGPLANKRKKKPRSPSLTPPPEMPAECEYMPVAVSLPE